MRIFEFHAGSTPLLISVPHAGTDLPQEIADSMTPAARRLPDTDWFLPRLYQLDRRHEVNWIAADVSRYVVDLNRPTSDENLYPGQNTTRLCPESNFDGTPVYLDGAPISPQERSRRIDGFWKPYHQRLQSALEAIVQRHGRAVLLDAHSIASQVPNLFPGTLPDLNFGTNHGKSSGREFQEFIESFAKDLDDYSSVVNGRFVGGFITRHYGNPDRGVDAVQLEIAQSTYMDESKATWHDDRARLLQRRIDQFIGAIQAWISSGAASST